MLSLNYGWGYPFTFFNGEIYEGQKIPLTYIIINLFYKTPEYIIFLILIFIIFFKKINSFNSQKINSFLIKTTFVILNIILPTFLLLLNPFAIYDGFRLKYIIFYI